VTDIPVKDLAIPASADFETMFPVVSKASVLTRVKPRRGIITIQKTDSCRSEIVIINRHQIFTRQHRY
jgi:hypothetical protein